MTLTIKNIEILAIQENKDRCRCAYLYDLKVKNTEKELDYRLDSNHEIILNQGEIQFLRKKNWDNKKWDYNKWPIGCAILSLEGNGNHVDDIIRYFNDIYKKHEEKWKHK
jgi:hypothetical protein